MASLLTSKILNKFYTNLSVQQHTNTQENLKIIRNIIFQSKLSYMRALPLKPS